MQDAEPRQLMKQLPRCTAAIARAPSPTPIGGVVVQGQGWESITPSDPTVSNVTLVNRTYIDLAGYTQKELTTFIQSVAIQHMRDPLVIGGATISTLYSYDFITSRKLLDSELNDLSNIAPGFLGSTLDLMEMIYGQHRTYAVNANIPSTFITTDTDTLGSGNPTASDRLHWTRVFYCSPGGGDEDNASLVIYDANLVCQAVTGKEKDLIYIERLRRAYTQDPGRNV